MERCPRTRIVNDKAFPGRVLAHRRDGEALQWHFARVSSLVSGPAHPGGALDHLRSEIRTPPTAAAAHLTVRDAGLYTLLVDQGRPRTRSLGVPLGGAADRTSLVLGNTLIGNPPDAPALEITLRGPTVCSDRPLACVLFGAPFEMTAPQRRLAPGRTFTLEAGEPLYIGGTPRGARAYLCLRGGVLGPPILGSVSSLEPLRSGQELPCLSATTGGRALHGDADDVCLGHLANPVGTPVLLRAIAGPQIDWFVRDQFFGTDRLFQVTPSSNRMGLRLHGEPLTVPERELVSEPVTPGAVQITRDGQAIVLGVDGQTIGGYPKVAVVISADFDRLGQLRPGDRVRFEEVDMEEAERLYRQKQTALREWVVRMCEAEVFAVPGRASMASGVRRGELTPEETPVPLP